MLKFNYVCADKLYYVIPQHVHKLILLYKAQGIGASSIVGIRWPVLDWVRPLTAAMGGP